MADTVIQKNIITYVVAAILLGAVVIGVILFGDVQERVRQGGQESAEQLIELRTVSTLPAKLRFDYIDNGSVSLINVSTDALNDTIPVNDYAIDADAGIIASMNNTDWGPSVYANYTYIVGTYTFNISKRGSQLGLANLSSNFGAISFVVAIIVILSILLIIARRRFIK